MQTEESPKFGDDLITPEEMQKALAAQRKRLAAEYDKLDAELVRVRKVAKEEIESLIAELKAMKLERDALRAKVVDLEPDAKRYRFLRSQPNDTGVPRIDVVYWTEEDAAVNYGEGLRNDSLDSAIDAAIAATEEKS